MCKWLIIDSQEANTQRAAGFTPAVRQVPCKRPAQHGGDKPRRSLIGGFVKLMPFSVTLSLAVLVVGLAQAQSPQSGGKDKKDSDASIRDAGQKALEESSSKKPKGGTLEELLAKAIKNNPDILVAEAKVREADAELNRVRQQVMQKIVVLTKEIDAHQALVKEYVIRAEREDTLRRQGRGSEGDFRAAEATLQKAKAESEVLQAKIPYLVGQAPKGLKAGANCASCHDTANSPSILLMGDECAGAHRWAGLYLGKEKHLEGKAPAILQPKIQETLAEKIRAALDTPLKCDYTEATLTEILGDLADRAKGINIQLNAPDVPKDFTTTLKLANPVPLGAALQWLEDRLELRCIIRNYGVVLVHIDRVPPGAVLLQDFWKTPPKAEKK